MHSDLERVLRVLNERNLLLVTSIADIAKIAGLSRQSIHNAKSQFSSYLATSPESTQEDYDVVDQQLLSIYVDHALVSSSEDRLFAQVTGAVAGYVLRHKSNLVNDALTIKKIVTLGQHYLSLICQVTARKYNVGTPIHSQGKAAKYLLTELGGSELVDALFTRTDSYIKGTRSKLWSMSSEGLEVNELIKHYTIKLIDKYLKDWRERQAGLGMCSEKSVNFKVTSELPENRFVNVSLSKIGTLSVPSFLQVMGVAEPSISEGYLSVPLRNLANIDPSKGRTYNIFTRLRSEERKALGFKNYDISGGLQIICFNVLSKYSADKYKDFDDLTAKFPLIFQYGFDPEAKSSIRNEISEDLDISVEEVKRLLTAYSNGSQKKVGDSKKLQDFFDQSDLLRREVLSVVKGCLPELLESAMLQSKQSFPEDYDWQSIEKEKSSKEARGEASVFFFVWTFFEKEIRDAMLTILIDGIPLHDAVYSRLDVKYELLEEVIFKETGFQLKVRN